MLNEKIPTFVYCEDGKYYQNLVYCDNPLRREWFVCFDPKEPAEFVKRDGSLFDPLDVLKRRGFEKCLKGIFNARPNIHKRFFGLSYGETQVKSEHAADAVSWYLLFKRGVPLPTPNKYDGCDDWFDSRPVVKDGVFFGLKGD